MLRPRTEPGMNEVSRTVASVLREIAETIGARVLPIKWGQLYFERQLAKCEVSRVDRRSVLLSRLIVVANRRGDLITAETAARTVLQLVPDDPWAPIELATILEKQGRLVEAKELYERMA